MSETSMETEVKQAWSDLNMLIDSSRKVSRLATEIIGEVEGIDKHHRTIGFRGMAHRHKILNQADPQRYDAMRDEYTLVSMETMKALATLHHLINGIKKGSDETYAAKAAMEN